MSKQELDNLSKTEPLWKKRVEVVQLIYSYLINPDLGLKIPAIEENWKKIYDNFVINMDKYITCINSLLSDGWETDRINQVTLSIMLEIISESDCLDTPIPVLLKESVVTAKKHCDPNEYRLVNALLENYFKKYKNFKSKKKDYSKDKLIDDILNCE